MEENSLPMSEIFLNNGDVEWQPLALTLVEYPKGKITWLTHKGYK